MQEHPKPANIVREERQKKGKNLRICGKVDAIICREPAGVALQDSGHIWRGFLTWNSSLAIILNIGLDRLGLKREREEGKKKREEEMRK